VNRDEASALSGFIDTHDHHFRTTSTYPLFQVLGQPSTFVVEAEVEDAEPELFATIPTYVYDALQRDPDLRFILDLKQWLLTIKRHRTMP
jgi:hypothetical protein